VLASCIANVVAHGNPVYPVMVDAFGISLPGKEGQVNTPASLAAMWEGVSRPLVWLASIFEVQAYVSRPMTWDVGQGNVDRSAPSFRMGGYFGVYVLANLVVFAHMLRNTVRPVAYVCAGVLAAITVMTAMLPASHELRYYMYWIMALIVMNAALATRPELAISSVVQRGHREIYSWVVLVAFAAVTAISGGMYLDRSESVPTHVQVVGAGISARVAETFMDGQVNCMGMAYDPFRFLYASLFHPGRTYTVRELAPDESTAGCDVVIP
jgi:hypothetical protein